MNQHQLNKQIEAFIQEKDTTKAGYTDADKEYILKYEGSGGQASKGATGEGLLYEFYTPDYVCNAMWDLARHHGFNEDGYVLEPSVGTGRLIQPAKDYSKCVGFEINPTSARIAEIVCPKATIHRGYFETVFLKPPRFAERIKTGNHTWLKQYPFSLVIGNPPYGIYKNKYSAYFPEGKRMKQIENFFFFKGLQLLEKGGLLIYLTGSNFLRNGQSYNEAKKEIGEYCDLIDAYRLPPVFSYSQVPTDIIILRKK